MNRKRLRRLRCEPLEARELLSVNFYDMEVVVQTGALNSIGKGISINDLGEVAFQATRTENGEDVDNIFTALPGLAYAPLMAAQFEYRNSGAAPTQTFSPAVQINNSGKVLAQRLLNAEVIVASLVNAPTVAPLTYLETWTTTSGGLPSSLIINGDGGLSDSVTSWTGIPASACPLITPLLGQLPLCFVDPVNSHALPSPFASSPFSAVFGGASINDQGLAAFRALDDSGDSGYRVTGPHSGGLEFPGGGIGSLKINPVIANGTNNGGNGFIAWNDETGRIWAEPSDFSSGVLQLVATRQSDGGDFFAAGPPAISDDGMVIAFAGSHVMDGEGVFISVFESTSGLYSPPNMIASTTEFDGLGYLANGDRIRFSDFDETQRVSVIHNSSGVAGIAEDDIVVAFVATPAHASRENPTTPGTPFLFSDAKGVWTTSIKPSRRLDGTGPITFSNKSSPIPVIQVGDQVAGLSTITDLAIHDSLSKGLVELDGISTRAHVGSSDHQIAVWIETTSGEAVIRGTQYDSDEDGLFNHWERNRGGIDVNRDGIVDLDLASMGANPLRQDMFLEIDWLKPDRPSSNLADHRTFAPLPSALDFVVNAFNSAPVTNPDGSTGISLHIDAGVGLSKNFGGSVLDGGEFNMLSSGNHIHAVYPGVDGSIPVSGTDNFGRPRTGRSLDSIKRSSFGGNDLYARELAFRYAFFADEIEGVGGAIGVAESAYFDYQFDYRSMPGNDVLLGLKGKTKHSSGLLNSVVGGAPAAEPSGHYQSSTLLHELGHTLGLLHGGPDMTTFDFSNPVAGCPKPNYKSVMNYCYGYFTDANGKIVDTFSDSTDAVFDDWSIADLGFSRHFDGVGNSFYESNRRVDTAIPDAELSEADVESINGLLGLSAVLPCDYVGGGDGCDVRDINALYAGTGSAPGPLSNALIIQWLVDASSVSNPLKLTSATMYVLGDVNLDGTVDSTDLGLVLNNFSDTSGLGWTAGNLNSDAVLDSTDLGLLLNNFGFESVAVAAVSATPPPSVDVRSLFGDVNGDGQVAPRDALQIINALNDGEQSTMAMDLNGDGVVAPADALFVVNRLNRAAIAVDRAYAELDADEEEKPLFPALKTPFANDQSNRGRGFPG